MKMNIKNVEAIFLILVVLLYLTLGLSYIRLPGLFCEEAVVGNNVVSTMDILKSTPLFDAIKNKRLPTSFAGRHGALEIYILLPFFYLFGVNPVALRLEPLIFGIFTIIFTYLFTKELFNRKAAFLATALLVIHPGFIISIKTGTDCASLMQSFSIASLFCFLRWYQKKGHFYLYLGMFLLGLGLNVRIWFLWIVLAIFVTALIFLKDFLKRVLPDKLSLAKCVIVGGFSFFLGASLFLYHNLYQYFLSLSPALRGVIFNDLGYVHEVYGITSLNRNYFDNLLRVLGEFNMLIKGHFFSMVQLGVNSGDNNLYPIVFWTSLLWIFLSLLLRRKMPSKKRTSFLLILFFGILAQMPVAVFRPPTAITHLPILYPFPQILLGIAVSDCVYFLRKTKIMPIIIIGFLLTLGLENLSVMQKYFYHLKKTGGAGDYSDAVYRLSDYLLKRKCLRPIILSSTLNPTLPLVSGVSPVGSGCEAEFIDILKEKFKNKDNLYIAYSQELVETGLVREMWEPFRKAAREMNKTIVEEKKFYQRDGKPVYVVYRVY